MSRSLHVALLIAFTTFAAPAAHAETAGGPPVVHGRAHKRAHRPKAHKPGKPRQPQASRAQKRNDRGFEL